MTIHDAILAKAAARHGVTVRELVARSGRDEAAAATVAALAMQHAAYSTAQIAAAIGRCYQTVWKLCHKATKEQRALAHDVWIEVLSEHEGPVPLPTEAA